VAGRVDLDGVVVRRQALDALEEALQGVARDVVAARVVERVLEDARDAVVTAAVQAVLVGVLVPVVAVALERAGLGLDAALGPQDPAVKNR